MAKRRLEEFKFIVVPVFTIHEGDKLVGEQQADQIVLYGLDQLEAFAEKFRDDLADLNAKHDEG